VWKRLFLPVLAILLAASLESCFEDDTVGPPPAPRNSYKTLDADGPRDNVLHNLQLSWNDRNINRYDQLLDADFIFYFSPADVSGGVVSGEYWSRAAEINANQNMFDPNYSNPVQDPVEDIDLTLSYPAGDEEWTPIDAPDQLKYPGETWYDKVVTYNLTVQITGDFQYVGRNKQAQFTVRAATRDSKQYWQIVVWRDDTGTGVNDLVRAGRCRGISQDTTWGQVKALYGE
jgi:hypothetical protein